MFDSIFSTKTQLALAWFCLLASLIGWPITLITTNEPPFILSLSWLALTLTAFNWISAAEANRRVEIQSDHAEVETETATVDAEHVRVEP